MFKDAIKYAKKCYVCQRVGQISQRDELPLHPIRALEAFEKWAINFLGPINPPVRHSHAQYIITTTDYLTCWAEAATIKDCTANTATPFIFENIITCFGCPKSLTSDKELTSGRPIVMWDFSQTQ